MSDASLLPWQGPVFKAIIIFTARLPSPLAHPCQRVFEAIILIAGLQPDADIQLAVMGILFSTHSLVFMVNGEGGIGRAYGDQLSSAHGRHPCICFFFFEMCESIELADFSPRLVSTPKL